MTMDLQPVLNAGVFAAACMSVAAFMCRLDALRYRHHRAAVILLHACLGAASAAAGHRAWLEEAGLLELATVAGSLLWIVISWPDWRNGVPEQFHSGPVPFDDTAPHTR
jgi:hypothetical protein